MGKRATVLLFSIAIKKSILFNPVLLQQLKKHCIRKTMHHEVRILKCNNSSVKIPQLALNKISWVETNLLKSYKAELLKFTTVKPTTIT